jgi:hypothetical protein
MKWKRIPKENAEQPAAGGYRNWKQQIANEGFNQCVYCAIHEASFGGIRNFNVEHYKPKSKYGDLVDDIQNLYYACPICNTFKSNDWPADPAADFSNLSYPDPSKVDYSEIMEFDQETGLVKGKYVAGVYIITKLNLNRGQLVLERKWHAKSDDLDRTVSSIRDLVPHLQGANDKEVANKFLAQIVYILADIQALTQKLRTLPPYEIADTQRQQ